MPNATPTSLEALAEWVRTLPIESFAPIGVLLVGGLLLLAFGQKLLKPVLVFAAVFAGVIIAVRYAQASQSTMSPLLWSLIGALAGFLAVVLSYRVALGLAVGSLGAIAAMLLATAAAEYGFVDVGAKTGNEDMGGESRSSYVSGPTAVAAAGAIVDPLATPSGGSGESSASHSISQELDRVSPGLGPSFLAWLERCQAFLSSSGTWVKSRWDGLPAPMRTLLFASGAAGGFLGFVAGISSPAWAAATVTSLLGSLLTLLCGVPIASRFLPDGTIPHLSPLGWLAAWLGLSALGALFQWYMRKKKDDEKREPQREPKAA